MANNIPKVKLEKIAKEKLSVQIISDIDAIEVEIYEKVESGLTLKIDRKTIELRLNYKASTKKFLSWLSSITITMGGVITILKWLMPILVDYLAKPPP